MLGYQVTGIDIQNYGYAHPNFDFIHDDFNKHDFGTEKFDIITNISAIEHFGLLFYGNMNRDDNADKKAIAKIKQLLKPKGQFLFTAPFGVHGEVENFERIYDTNDINTMFQGFKILEMKAYLLTNAHYLEEIAIKEAEKIKHNEEEQTYAIICLNAERI
jgi:SAM-dependent methyltransferase